jgi:homoaconitase/3-isopropylmalate dehydratase large subunit
MMGQSSGSSVTVPRSERSKTGRTLIDKLWDAHAITTREDGTSLIWIDRHLVHEGSFLAFDQVAERGGRVAHPELTFGIADHYVPTRGPLAASATGTSPECSASSKTIRNARGSN